MCVAIVWQRKSDIRISVIWIKNQTPVKAGEVIYAVCMDKSVSLFQIGKKPLEEGMNILGAHIDSPRIDVKQNPLYESS